MRQWVHAFATLTVANVWSWWKRISSERNPLDSIHWVASIDCIEILILRLFQENQLPKFNLPKTHWIRVTGSELSLNIPRSATKIGLINRNDSQRIPKGSPTVSGERQGMWTATLIVSANVLKSLSNLTERSAIGQRHCIWMHRNFSNWVSSLFGQAPLLLEWFRCYWKTQSNSIEINTRSKA